MKIIAQIKAMRRGYRLNIKYWFIEFVGQILNLLNEITLYLLYHII